MATAQTVSDDAQITSEDFAARLREAFPKAVIRPHPEWSDSVGAWFYPRDEGRIFYGHELRNLADFNARVSQVLDGKAMVQPINRER